MGVRAFVDSRFCSPLSYFCNQPSPEGCGGLTCPPCLCPARPATHYEAVTTLVPPTTTPEPPVKPRLGALTVTAASPGSLSLSWTVPEGQFDHFLVQYKNGDGQPKAVRVPGHEDGVTISGLEPDHKYKMHLYGFHDGQRQGPVSATGVTGEWTVGAPGGRQEVSRHGCVGAVPLCPRLSRAALGASPGLPEDQRGPWPGKGPGLCGGAGPQGTPPEALGLSARLCPTGSLQGPGPGFGQGLGETGTSPWSLPHPPCVCPSQLQRRRPPAPQNPARRPQSAPRSPCWGS